LPPFALESSLGESFMPDPGAPDETPEQRELRRRFARQTALMHGLLVLGAFLGSATLVGWGKWRLDHVHSRFFDLEGLALLFAGGLGLFIGAGAVVIGLRNARRS
jgi:hypothetical protein